MVTAPSLLSFKLKIIGMGALCLLSMVAIAAWIMWDYVAIERVGSDTIYRCKHNLGLIMLPGAAFMIGTGLLFLRLHRLGVIASLIFVPFGIYVAGMTLMMDTSNHHVRVSPDEVYSEWGTRADPQSSTIDLRQCQSLSLESVREDNFDRQYLIAQTKDGAIIELPVNDLVKYALKRILASAVAHKIDVQLPDQ